MEEIDFIRATGYLSGITIKNDMNRIVFESSYFISLENVIVSDSASTAFADLSAFFLRRRRAQDRWVAMAHSI
jgi:hypothetical protein